MSGAMAQWHPLHRLRRWIIAECTRLLTKPLAVYTQRVPNNAARLRKTLRPGDVLLVEGDQRISQVIRYLTQSSWSHCALYVGSALLRRDPQQAAALRQQFGDDAEHLLIEAEAGPGVVASPLGKYVRYNIRICRPQGLRREDVGALIDHGVAQLGREYDVRHILALLRFFFPVSLVPRRWRRAALTFGTTPAGGAVICSTLIADAFTNIGYPILPEAVPEDAPATGRRWSRWLGGRTRPVFRFRRPNTALITPRDFDLSPYFEVIKFNHLGESTLDYRRIIWEEGPRADTGSPAAEREPPPERPRARALTRSSVD